MFDKEKEYDELIAPLMDEILKICKRENIPFSAQFALKSHHLYEDEHDAYETPMRCTSLTPSSPEVHGEEIDQWHQFVAESMRYGPNGRPFVMTSTIAPK